MVWRYPVTQAEWQEVMGDNPSHFKNKPRHPVESVKWDRVQEFVKALNAKLGNTRPIACRRSRSGNISVEEGHFLLQSRANTTFISRDRRPTSRRCRPTIFPPGKPTSTATTQLVRPPKVHTCKRRAK